MHLKEWFALTLVDLSEDMLAVSRQLNPECEHRQGDKTEKADPGFQAARIEKVSDLKIGNLFTRDA